MTQALTGIGEIGIDYEGRTYILRPSLHAMTQIGDPAEIIAVFAALHSEPATPAARRQQFLLSLNVLYACAADGDDIGPIVGWITERNTYRPGVAPAPDLIVLARSLMRHGVIGDVPADPHTGNREGGYTSTFDAREYAALAMAHLGSSERDAWALTMTGFLAAMRAKHPPGPKPGSQAPTPAEHDVTMAWLARVNAARSAANV